MNDELIAKTPIGEGNADDFTHLIEHEHILKTFE